MKIFGKNNKTIPAQLKSIRKVFEGSAKKVKQPVLRRLMVLPWNAAKTSVRLMRIPLVRYAALAAIAIFLLSIVYLLNQLPSPRRLTHNDNYAVSTQIFDRNGKILYEIYADENRIPIGLESIPPYVYQASIAIEDKNYHKHFGIDFQGITRALVRNFRGERLEGGSTITQQLVKNALLTRDRTVQRKIKEAVLAVFTEIIYSKDEILEMYLNYISYGGTSVGIEAAARSYLDKSAADLTLAEAALLAGLPKAPSTYSPFGSNPEAAKQRQLEVLRRMREDGYITKEQEEEAANEVLHFALSTTDIQAPHFVFYVRDLLYEKYGVETVEKGGLRVTTTLDLDIQEAAQASVSAEVERLASSQVGNGAALVAKPNTGEILAMVGSKNYFNATAEGQVNVTLAQRQPGSSIKPLMYASAIQERVLNPGSILLDVPTCFTVAGQPPYCPKNYDGSFKGPVTVRESLGNSLNIPAVKSQRIIGTQKFMDQATAMGITSWKDPSKYGLSLTLGGGEVRMIDMVQAFSTLANEGVKVPLTPIIKIEDYQGKVYEETDFDERRELLSYLNDRENERRQGELQRVMDRAPAYLVSHILQDNNARARAFGTRSELVIPGQIVSVKTGTTNDLKDNWTIGYTPEYIVATWVGNNDNKPMNRRVVSGVTGAAPIWNDIMTFMLQGVEPHWQEKPRDVASASVCVNGMPPSESNRCAARQTELYWTKGKPSLANVVQKEFWIDPTTGLPPPFGEEIEGLVLEFRTFYQDPVTEFYCADCNRPQTEDGKIQYEQNTVDERYEISESRYFEQSSSQVTQESSEEANSE